VLLIVMEWVLSMIEDVGHPPWDMVTTSRKVCYVATRRINKSRVLGPRPCGGLTGMHCHGMGEAVYVPIALIEYVSWAGGLTQCGMDFDSLAVIPSGSSEITALMLG